MDEPGYGLTNQFFSPIRNQLFDNRTDISKTAPVIQGEDRVINVLYQTLKLLFCLHLLFMNHQGLLPFPHSTEWSSYGEALALPLPSV
jgi:hypothetical protein